LFPDLSFSLYIASNCLLRPQRNIVPVPLDTIFKHMLFETVNVVIYIIGFETCLAILGRPSPSAHQPSLSIFDPRPSDLSNSTSPACASSRYVRFYGSELQNGPRLTNDYAISVEGLVGRLSIVTPNAKKMEHALLFLTCTM